MKTTVFRSGSRASGKTKSANKKTEEDRDQLTGNSRDLKKLKISLSADSKIFCQTKAYRCMYYVGSRLTAARGEVQHTYVHTI